MLKLLTEPSGTDPKKVAWVLNNVVHSFNAHFPEYDVETLAVLFRKATGEKMDESVKTKLKAYRALLMTPQPFEHWHVFEKVVSALIDGYVDTTKVNPPNEVEFVLSCYVIDRDAEKHFSNEVKRYVKALWYQHFGYKVMHPIVKKVFGERSNETRRQILSRFNEYVAKRPMQFPEPKDEIEAQAQRLYRLQLLLEVFINKGELPIEVIVHG